MPMNRKEPLTGLTMTQNQAFANGPLAFVGAVILTPLHLMVAENQVQALLLLELV